jgi:hypothetical protein
MGRDTVVGVTAFLRAAGGAIAVIGEADRGLIGHLCGGTGIGRETP